MDESISESRIDIYYERLATILYKREVNFYKEGERIIKLIGIIKRSFDSLRLYNQQELIQIVQTLDLSPRNVIPYITALKNLEVMVLYFASLAPPVHNHGTVL